MLKPYGFQIHGCIDGYSMCVLWLGVIRSSKDPKEVRNLYFNYHLIAKGIPRKIVADRGTEKMNIAGSQRFSRGNHSDDSSAYQSFQFKKSLTNKRIKSKQRVSITSLMYKLVGSFFQGNCARGNV